MFPVLILYASVDTIEGSRVLGKLDIRENFAPELELFGSVEWTGNWIMSAGPYGASSYMQWRVHPRTALDLALLLEFVYQPHGDMLCIAMRDNSKLENSSLTKRMPTHLSLHIDGDDLDALCHTQSVGWSAKLSDEEAEIAKAAITDWNQVCERVEKLEAENRMLRAKLNSPPLYP